MKTYVIALERSKERFNYIINHLNSLNMDYDMIKAIDGRVLTEDDIKDSCDLEAVNKLRWWLNNGAIGCALSHLEAYKKISKSKGHCAFIVEDDVVLPENIVEILDEIEKEIKSEEIILLYYTSKNSAELSSINKVNLKNGSLCYPMDVGDPITAAAYIVSKQVAISLTKKIIPIRVTADSWSYYFRLNCFNSMRVHFPSLVEIKNFKSSIDYIEPKSFIGFLTSIIDEYKIPLLKDILKFRRRKRLNKMQGNFRLTDRLSPLQTAKIS